MSRAYIILVQESFRQFFTQGKDNKLLILLQS